MIASPFTQASLRFASPVCPLTPADQCTGLSPWQLKGGWVGRSALLLLLFLEIWTATGQTPPQSPPTGIENPTAGLAMHARILPPVPDKVTAQMNLALACYKKGDLGHAQQLLEKLHGSAPKYLGASVLLGYVYIKQGSEAKAAALLSPLERGHENDMGLEYVLAFSLIQTGKEKEGIPRMERVARVTRSANAYVVAGYVYLQRSHMRNALADLNAAMHLEPSLPGLSTMVGEAYYGLGDLKSATSAFRESLRANPWDFTANLDLGAIQLTERNYESARPLLELALESKPDFPLARLEMAKLNAATGRYAEAAAALESLVKAEPSYMDAHWALATVYFDLNRPEDGRRERSIAQGLRVLPHTP